MAKSRKFVESHPWIDFQIDLKALPPTVWMQLGESYSKCQHLVGTPLQPGVAMELSSVYMRRGALASAAIEGNSLSEADVEDIFVNKNSLPESQQYLEQEIENVLAVLEAVRHEAAEGEKFRLTHGWLKAVHFELLQDLEVEEHVVPGQYRQTSVGVGPYKAPSWGDVHDLMTSTIDWINEVLDDAAGQERDDTRFAYTFFAACLAHLYIAWVHPFGDGNGRTARIVEAAILANSGLVPWVSTSLLSDFYNRTRSMYYKRLEAASTERDAVGFLAYSALGLRDELRSQISVVQSFQKRVAWISFIHERFQGESSSAVTKRRREVALAMPENEIVTRQQIRHLTPQIAEMYAGTSDKLLRRDLTRLKELNLIVESGRGQFRSLMEQMDAFTPSQENGADTIVLPRLRENRFNNEKNADESST